MQTTLKSAATFEGAGLHTGVNARMTVRPAPAGHGIRFLRTDIARQGAGLDPVVPALWKNVTASRLCTVIANGDGVSVSTVEHIMAALAGCGVHNARIEIDGPEVPILDGSAAFFAAGLLAQGIETLDAPLMCLEILAPVEVREGEAVARLEPAETLEIAFSIDFADAAIGQQEKELVLANGAFVRELSDSRTFCRQADVEAMRDSGLALGGSYFNAVVVEGDRVLSPGGLRHADEAVRHKMLDALGDLALAGAPVLGRYTGSRAGHALTNRLLRAVFAQPGAVRMVEVADARRALLPGVDVTLDEVPLHA